MSFVEEINLHYFFRFMARQIILMIKSLTSGHGEKKTSKYGCCGALHVGTE